MVERAAMEDLKGCSRHNCMRFNIRHVTLRFQVHMQVEALMRSWQVLLECGERSGWWRGVWELLCVQMCSDFMSRRGLRGHSCGGPRTEALRSSEGWEMGQEGSWLRRKTRSPELVQTVTNNIQKKVLDTYGSSVKELLK